MNSKSVFKFLVLGVVTNMFEYPCVKVAAIASVSAADFPRADKVTVDEKVAERTDPLTGLTRVPVKSRLELVVTIVHPRPVSCSQIFADIVA